MAYAIRNDGLGWRSVDSKSDLLEGETYSETQPQLPDSVSHRVFEIRLRLAAIDTETIRPLRAIISGKGTKADDDKLTALETEASNLRSELAAL